MHSIPEAIEALSRGELIILTDDEDRENEGDLVCAAEKVTPELINFMAKHGRGLICLALDPAIVDQLDLPLMSSRNQSAFGTAFTISIEARDGVSTGISAADRSRTIQAAIDPKATREDLITPGHIFPLRAKKHGVLVRPGQTEGSVDLARMAGLRPAGVICEIMNDDGTMARLPDLVEFSKKHGIKLVTNKDLISYRMRTEVLVANVSSTRLPTAEAGEFQVLGYRSIVDETEHLALVKGTVESLLRPGASPLVRIHSECLTGDALGSSRCDCGLQLQRSMQILDSAGSGVLIYLRAQEGRGIGLLNKIKAYALQDQGLDTVEANEHLGFKPDLRHYGIAAQILKSLNLKKIQLLTNNPHKVASLESLGLEIEKRVSLETEPMQENVKYLRAKKDKMGHWLAEV